ncbi:43kDa postsynaptic protein [Parasponia andersonii]|uniref:RING-type E3 ubiquitin transferase n=1 Tax=Parasponia andersonii TaxID=3476 RepID=A0A2P5E3R4_PARAD|nr:43kDa postsynaptic protein [Parasponia andersonii]
MGISWSGRRRNNYLQNPPPVPPPLPPPPPPLPYYSPEPPLPPPPPPPPATATNFAFASATLSSYPAPPNSVYSPNPPPPVHAHYSTGPYGRCNQPNSMMGRYNYQPFYANQPNWWPPMRPPPMGQAPLPPQATPPPYVEHQNAKKVRNDVNVHKDTLRVEVDEHNPDHHLVSFVFDALYDGSITILYFAKEEPNCKFLPQYPDAFMPVRIPFQKGSGQKFRQPSGTGIDLGFFELDDLSKASPGEDVFPLVICAKTCAPPHSEDGHVNDPMQDASDNMQITQAVLEKRNTESFQVKVIRQILWVDGVRYELRDIFGIASSSVEGFNDNDPGKECVICMTEPKDTFVVPCRHMCMCSECAKELRLQSNKCPICRQPIEELVGIKINNDDQ